MCNSSYVTILIGLVSVGEVFVSFVSQKTPYQRGDPAFEFIVRPYENKKVTFETRKFAQCFLCCDQNAVLSVQELPPDSSEVQFVVRVQVYTGTCESSSANTHISIYIVVTSIQCM